MSCVRVLQAREVEAAQSNARLAWKKSQYGAVDQNVSVSESPEDKMDRQLQRTLRASAVRVDLRLARPGYRE